MIFTNVREPEPEVMATPGEVEAYDALTLKYMTILHQGFIETVLNNSPGSGRFLEVGCGTGRIAAGVAAQGPGIRMTAVDRSPAMLAVARKLSRTPGQACDIEFRMADGRCLPFKNETFDAVFCHNMLHHLDDPLPMLREMKRVVKPGGAFLVRDLVRQPPFLAWAHTWGFGLTYSGPMKSSYYASMRAAFSRPELQEMIRGLALPGLRYTRQFITHHGMERPARSPRRTRVVRPVSLRGAWLKSHFSTGPEKE